MQQFDITLKNSKIKSYRLIALLIVLINFAVFIFSLIAGVHFMASSSAIFLITSYCLYRFYHARKFNTGFYMDEISLFILTGCWVVLQNYVLAFASALMAALYYLSLQKIQFGFNADSIKKINFPSVVYPWSMFTNVLLKDKILTLDFTNNKLLQAEIENENVIDEKVFNAFAKQCLLNQPGLKEKLISE